MIHTDDQWREVGWVSMVCMSMGMSMGMGRTMNTMGLDKGHWMEARQKSKVSSSQGKRRKEKKGYKESQKRDYTRRKTKGDESC